jgi:hypothetical protein
MFTTGIGMKNLAAAINGKHAVDITNSSKKRSFHPRKGKSCPEKRQLRLKVMTDRAISMSSLRQCDYAKALSITYLRLSI